MRVDSRWGSYWAEFYWLDTAPLGHTNSLETLIPQKNLRGHPAKDDALSFFQYSSIF